MSNSSTASIVSRPAGAGRPSPGIYRNSPARVLFLLLALCLPLAGTPVFAAPQFPYIVVDRQSGGVLLEHEAFQRWYPASLTKLMTLYVTLQAIADGEIAPGSPVTMSKLAASQPPSKMGYAPGVRLRVDTAMKILIVKSANDVAVALAEAVAGSVDRFVERMNETARDIGMTDSRFSNPNGLHAESQYVTARDMALLARRILADFPAFAPNFAIPALRSGDKLHYSYNLLLERFSGADGMKTGFVCASGYNMVASATRGDRQLIAVVLGTFSQTDRAVAAARLLLQGFEAPGGPTVADFRAPGEKLPARDMRATMCSEKARQTRYDPGAGQARIDSPLLDPRHDVAPPVAIATGGIDAPPSDAFLTARLVPTGNVPVPAPRPDTTPRDVDGEPLTEARSPGPIIPGPIIPVPTRRPSDSG